MEEKIAVPSLFDYFNYREYLHDFYQFHKRKNSSYSYRLFARKAKLGSPNYLKLVVDGKRKITYRTLFQFSRGLGLSKDEEKYFRELVMYQEVSDPESKQAHLRSLLKYQEKQRAPQSAKNNTIRYFSEWHHCVIRELINTKTFVEDTAWIVKKLKGKVTETQAKQSLSLLEDLELIGRNAKGRYVVLDPLLTSSKEIPAHYIRSLHRTFLRKAMNTLLVAPVEKREMSGLVMSIPASKLKEIKEEIKEFRKKLNRRFGAEKEGDEVYYIGLYLFPVTDPI